MNYKILILLIALIVYVNSEHLDTFLNTEDALEFNDDDQSVSKRFLYTGKEQRREAKENYEEKCERKLLSSVRNKPRWCPELDEWQAWQSVTSRDGYKPKNLNMKPNHRPGSFNGHQINRYPSPGQGFNQPFFQNQPTPVPFNPNNYPFNQNGNYQFNNEFRPANRPYTNQPQFPFKSNKK